MGAVTLDQVSKVYRTKRAMVQAVRGLDLAVADGELVVLVGPSGCGKTTTLRLIAGLEEISSGTVRIGDRVVNRIPPRDRDVAMVFQDHALYPHMTVFGNMAFGLKMRGSPRAEIKDRVSRAARMLAIDDLLERKPGQLSGGQRQRVAVGRAVVRRPEVFLLDEPLSDLDAQQRVELRGELKSLHRQLGVTMIHVTHDQEEAMTLGDRIVVMRNGTVHQCDTPLNVYRFPADRFVAGFIGTPRMNFLDVQTGNDSRSVVWSGHRLRLDDDGASPNNSAPGQSLILGIRPEHVTLGLNADRTTAGKTAWQSVDPLTIEAFEPLGHATVARLVCADGAKLTGLAPADADLSLGQRVSVRIDMSRAHWFAADDQGRRLA